MAGTMLFTIYGQLILKWRLGNYGPLPELLVDKVVFLLRLLTDVYILSGFMAAFFASLFWMAAMTKADLSYAYPIISGGLLLLTTISAIVLLGESLSMLKALGILIVILGVVVLYLSERI